MVQFSLSVLGSQSQKSRASGDCKKKSYLETCYPDMGPHSCVNHVLLRTDLLYLIKNCNHFEWFHLRGFV